MIGWGIWESRTPKSIPCDIIDLQTDGVAAAVKAFETTNSTFDPSVLPNARRERAVMAAIQAYLIQVAITEGMESDGNGQGNPKNN